LSLSINLLVMIFGGATVFCPPTPSTLAGLRGKEGLAR
jgi:hypothetical protein